MSNPSRPHGAGWRCAAGTEDITPPFPVSLAGYGREARVTSVFSPLELNAILLTDGATRVLLVSADLLFIGATLDGFIRAAAVRIGIAADCVITIASHTHFAPATDRSKPHLGQVSEAYLDFVLGAIGRLIERLGRAEQRAVTVERASVDTELTIGRRKSWPFPTIGRSGIQLRSTVLAPNPAQPVDRAVDVLRIVDREHRPVALFWKIACHPTAFPGRDVVSAEFPGQVRGAIRSTLGRTLPVVFGQGFSGDVRPRLRGHRSLAQRIRTFRVGPGFGTATLPEWTRWSEALAKVTLNAVASDHEAVGLPLAVASVAIPLAALIGAQEGIASRQMTIRRIGLGEKTALYALGAEVCSPYRAMIRDNADVIAIGCAGDVFGYLPTDEQAAAGGYEAAGFWESFSLKGPFQPGFEQFVRSAIEACRPKGQSASSSIG